ncbi:hypothetical protein [Microbacterium sp. SLBN-111]|uniref:hypothetical protein n=1 Tax=Microbacterium sp. SLBN-111 TaxID=3377733 RepID=UPI003C753C3E
MSIEEPRDPALPTVGSVVMTQTLIDDMTREMSGVRGSARAADKWIGLLIPACLAVATVETAIAGLWIAFAALVGLVIISVAAAGAARRGRRAHLTALHAPGMRVSVVVSDDQLELETPTVYAAYSREVLAPAQVREHGVYVPLGSGVIALPRAALRLEDIARLLERAPGNGSVSSR